MSDMVVDEQFEVTHCTAQEKECSEDENEGRVAVAAESQPKP